MKRHFLFFFSVPLFFMNNSYDHIVMLYYLMLHWLENGNIFMPTPRVRKGWKYSRQFKPSILHSSFRLILRIINISSCQIIEYTYFPNSSSITLCTIHQEPWVRLKLSSCYWWQIVKHYLNCGYYFACVKVWLNPCWWYFIVSSAIDSVKL